MYIKEKVSISPFLFVPLQLSSSYLIPYVNVKYNPKKKGAPVYYFLEFSVPFVTFIIEEKVFKEITFSLFNLKISKFSGDKKKRCTNIVENESSWENDPCQTKKTLILLPQFHIVNHYEVFFFFLGKKLL